jgi:hypothetical protein
MTVMAVYTVLHVSEGWILYTIRFLYSVAGCRVTNCTRQVLFATFSLEAECMLDDPGLGGYRKKIR